MKERRNFSAILENRVRESLGRADVRKVLAGVSGGADSVALLRLLVSAGAEVTAVHCNFHLRGEESDRDEVFTRDVCRQCGVNLIVRDVDVAAYQAEHKCSVETACRDTRYAIFREIMAERGAERIAVAHNSDDQAETLLLHLFRGAGVRGLCGMLEDTGEILRPLLSTSRSEIEEYLREINRDFVTDSTNLSIDYRRNYIRHKILPDIEERWPGIRSVLARTAMRMQTEERMLRSIEEVLIQGDAISYDAVMKSASPDWTVYRFASRYGASPTVCEEIARTLTSGNILPGKIWRVEDGCIATQRDSLRFFADDSIEDPAAENPKGADGDHPFRIESLPPIVGSFIDLKREMKAKGNDEFWGDIPAGEIEFRHWREGDMIEPLGMKGRQLVSKIMKDAKYSIEQKRRQWIMCDRRYGKILWLPGLKRSRHSLIKPSAENPLHIILAR